MASLPVTGGGSLAEFTGNLLLINMYGMPNATKIRQNFYLILINILASIKSITSMFLNNNDLSIVQYNYKTNYLNCRLTNLTIKLTNLNTKLTTAIPNKSYVSRIILPSRMTRQVEKKRMHMYIIKYTNNATVCIDSQQNMYSCSKCVSWSFYLLHV